MNGKNMQADHSRNGRTATSNHQADGIDLQIRVLRKALARIQELQHEYSFVETEFKTQADTKQR